MPGADPAAENARDNARRKRLRWRCRRGMRELDVLLEPWFDAHATTLNDEELDTFERLLESTDMDLYHWVTGRGKPADDTLASLLTRILAS